MKKFRKWFFRLLTGYDLIKYEDVMKEWKATLDLADKMGKTNEQLVKHSGEVIDLLKSYLNGEMK
jgi:hypothetical protein